MEKRQSKADISTALANLRGADLIDDLRSYAPIGEEGIVAGQALASVALRRLGIKHDAPINDVDVFLRHRTQSARATAIVDERRKSKKVHISRMAEHVTSAGGYFSDGHYSKMFHSTTKEGYHLLATVRAEMLNEVVFDRLESHLGHADARVVINGFDLNCVQIAADASTGELIWTPAFEDFLHSWQLKVANVNTPFHTAARYFKKKRALGCYGDDELNMAICAMPSARGVFDGQKKYGPGHCDTSCVAGLYGAKAHQDYQDEAADLSIWFKEVKARSKANIWTMEPVFMGHEKLLETIKSQIHPDSAQGVWAGDTTKLLLANASAWCESRLRPSSKAVADRIDAMESKLAAHSMPSEPKTYIVDMARIRGKEWLGAEDLSDQEARSLSKVLESHMSLMGALGEFPPKKQGQICAGLRQREEIHGDKLYGWLEALDVPRNYGRRPMPNAPILSALLEDMAKLDEYCANQKLGGERRLAQPLDLGQMARLATRAAKSLLGVQFKELVTINELEAEGRDMRHCVGGYANAVESGRSRIIQVIGPDGSKIERSTLEASISSYAKDELTPTKLHLGQNRSFANADPGPSANAAALMLTAAYGATSRKDRLLAIAPALCQALKDGAVKKSKLRSAGALLRLAHEEAVCAGERYESVASTIKDALGAHFPEPQSRQATPPQIMANPAGAVDNGGSAFEEPRALAFIGKQILSRLCSIGPKIRRRLG